VHYAASYAASAFNADKARRLSVPLTDDVPPQHLMRPVHSAGRRCAASTFNELSLSLWRTATGPSYRQRACPIRWQVACPYCRMRHTHHDSRVTERAAARSQYCKCYGHYCTQRGPGDYLGAGIGYSIAYSFRFAPGPTCWSPAPLYVPPLSYKREGTRRYKRSSFKPT
jgi:hypothetical protein